MKGIRIIKLCIDRVAVFVLFQYLKTTIALICEKLNREKKCLIFGS